MFEIMERLRWWLTPGKDCRGCCLGCRYFHMCKQDKPSGGVPVLMYFGRRRVATVYMDLEV